MPGTNMIDLSMKAHCMDLAATHRPLPQHFNKRMSKSKQKHPHPRPCPLQKMWVSLIQSTITLNTTETNHQTQQWFQTKNNENIAITIQKAVESRLHIPCAILRISKQQNTIKIHHRMSVKDADEVEQHMNWNAIAEGLKPHEDIHWVGYMVSPKTLILRILKSSNRSKKSITVSNLMPLAV